MNNKLCLRTQKYNFLLLYHNELLLLVSPLVQNFYKTSIFIKGCCLKGTRSTFYEVNVLVMTIQVPIEHTMNMVMYMESYVIIYLAITDLFSAFLFVLTAFLLAATICCSTHFSHTFHFCN